ncbi:MAG: hypothetical protein IT286_01335 [Proteobacteria bacterium]|nr:hypothetical protein [Pseudomonadota bacterium]
MKSIFVFLALVLTFTAASAETWTCTAFARKVFPVRGFLDLKAPVETNSNPNAKSPKMAAIKAIDTAFDYTAGKGTCNVVNTLDVQHKDNWPSRYAWIHHWKLNDKKQAIRTTDYFPNMSSDRFTEQFDEIVSREAEFINHPDISVYGCFYECWSR